VVEEEAVLEEGDGKDRGGDAGDGGGTAAMVEKAFVNEFAEDWDSAEDGVGQSWLSNWKISSVGQAKIRAKMRASSRLGT